MINATIKARGKFSDIPFQIFHISALAEGKREAWYIVQVESRIKESRLLAALDRGILNLTDYGTILASGYGKEAPEKIKSKFLPEAN